MESIINFNKVHNITGDDERNNLNNYSSEIINIISGIIEGDFKAYHSSLNTPNNMQNASGVIENYIGLYYDFALNNYDLAKIYYILAIKKGYNVAAYRLANMYEKQQKYDLAEKYYVIAIENGDNIVAYNLAKMYEKQKKYDLAEKYYVEAFHKDNIDAAYDLANMFEKQKKYELVNKYYELANRCYNQQQYDLAEKYYVFVIENGIDDAMCDLADMYDHQQKYDLAEKYYLMTIERGTNFAIHNFANMYNKQQKYELAEKYYVMAIEVDDNNEAIDDLANMYCALQKYDLAEKYYVMAIEKGNKNAMDNLELFFENDMRYFLCLTKINCANPKIDKQIKRKKNQLMKNKEIYRFANRLILNTKIEDCPVCMISQSLIPYDCSHFMCPTCYTKIGKCPICKYSAT